MHFPLCSESIEGFSPFCVSRRHPVQIQMPEPPQLFPFDAKEQQLYFKFPFNAQGSLNLSKAEVIHSIFPEPELLGIEVEVKTLYGVTAQIAQQLQGPALGLCSLQAKWQSTV